jgi:hypothetical protein
VETTPSDRREAIPKGNEKSQRRLRSRRANAGYPKQKMNTVVSTVA